MSFSHVSRLRWPMLRDTEITPVDRSTSTHRSAHSSPRRTPVTIASHTSVPHSGSAHASVRIRAASSGDGGRGLAFGAGGVSANTIGFDEIQPHRTARFNAPLRMKWIWRIVAAPSDLHLCVRQRSSHSWSYGVRWST
ncbi:MAG: hypothetical protein L0H64_06550 [Pseudonocardia sp.]|nr:hypothetical protein [Pseudonocardia sp.]